MPVPPEPPTCKFWGVLVLLAVAGCPQTAAAPPADPGEVVVLTRHGIEALPVREDGWYEVDDPDAVVLLEPACAE